MLHALGVIAFAVLFSSGPMRLRCILVKFGGFVVIVICHLGSIRSAPSAQQHAGIPPVPGSHGMVWRGFAESSITTLVSRPLTTFSSQLGRVCRMRRFRMVVVQVRSQMVSNDNVAGHSGFEKALLHVAREVRP
jgi:hypothetical protein